MKAFRYSPSKKVALFGFLFLGFLLIFALGFKTGYSYYSRRKLSPVVQRLMEKELSPCPTISPPLLKETKTWSISKGNEQCEDVFDPYEVEQILPNWLDKENFLKDFRISDCSGCLAGVRCSDYSPDCQHRVVGVEPAYSEGYEGCVPKCSFDWKKIVGIWLVDTKTKSLNRVIPCEGSYCSSPKGWINADTFVFCKYDQGINKEFTYNIVTKKVLPFFSTDD